MRFSPTQKHGALLNTVCVSVFTVGVLSYLFPAFMSALDKPVPPIYFTGFAVMCFITFLFLIMRYRMTVFEYVIKRRTDDSAYGVQTVPVDCGDSSSAFDFVVYKAIGARAGAMECVLSLGDFVEAISLKKGGESKSSVMKKYEKGKFSYYDYTLTFLPQDTLELIFEDGAGYVGVIIEDGNNIAEYFKKIAR